MTDVFRELAEYRQKMGLPAAGSEGDHATIAKLEIADHVFFGINSGNNPHRRKITMNVNAISRTHAEADAFQQAFDAGIRNGRAKLVVDRELCRACGEKAGVKGMAKQLGLEALEIITPTVQQIIQLKQI